MAEAIRTVPPPADGRIETGALQFGDDWPGIFIRGDNAMFMAGSLRSADPVILALAAERVAKLLDRCNLLRRNDG